METSGTEVPRLVLTSHGSEASGAVRRAAMSGVDGEGERATSSKKDAEWYQCLISLSGTLA